MKSIEQYVRDQITTLADLQGALQLAMQLEFSTIPPYLCAQWSINNDPSGVGDMIQNIVVQEMFHFALAGNMLTAVKGTPQVANAAFVPTYPTHELPGKIHQKLAVDLQPLSPAQLDVFMQIEQPEFPPVALAASPGPATIGEFYDTISKGFSTVNPPIDPSAHFVKMGEAVPITSIADAQKAIATIKAEGEGTKGDPDQLPTAGAPLAHYYVFKQIKVGKKLIETNGKFSFTGDPIEFPTVFSFKQSTASPDPSIAFNQALSGLLTNLQSCWTGSGTPSIGDMFQLQTRGQALIQQGIRPEFLWSA
jgi:hypothetical protein